MLVIAALFGVCHARRIKVHSRLGGRYWGEAEHRDWQSLVRECASLMPHSYRDHGDVVLYVDNQVLRPSLFGCRVKRIDMMYDESVFRARVVLGDNKTPRTCRLPQLDEFVISAISKEQATRIANAIRQQVLGLCKRSKRPTRKVRRVLRQQGALPAICRQGSQTFTTFVRRRSGRRARPSGNFKLAEKSYLHRTFGVQPRVASHRPEQLL